jgi:CRP-like cAMP-binding protein
MALEDDVRRLSRIPLLAVLEEDALRLLAFSAEARILRAGDVIFRAGDPADSGYFVTSGSVTLDPGESDRVQIVGTGALIGETAMITGSNRPVTAKAREPTTVLKFSRTQFHRVLQEYPASAARLRRAMSERLVTMVEALQQVPGFEPEPPPAAES